jgi:hypothetical protein
LKSSIRLGVFVEKGTAMNDDADCLDQADEEILASTISDEALEAAAGTQRGDTRVSPRVTC